MTNQMADDGKFKTPSLRNVTLTAPYMHDGSMNTLEEVIAMYERGGRNFNRGDGKNNIHKDKRINGFRISQQDKKDLLNFLFSLTDSTILTNVDFQNPFPHNNN